MLVQQEEANTIGKTAEGAVSAVITPGGPGKEASGHAQLELRAEVSGHTCLIP